MHEHFPGSAGPPAPGQRVNGPFLEESIPFPEKPAPSGVEYEAAWVQETPGSPRAGQPGEVYEQVSYAQVPWSPKSKLAAGLFGILLGTFGVHNFYLGFTGKAVAQLLITVLSFGMLSFVSGIWGLVEGILVLASQTGTKWDLDAQGYPMPPLGS